MNTLGDLSLQENIQGHELKNLLEEITQEFDALECDKAVGLNVDEEDFIFIQEELAKIKDLQDELGDYFYDCTLINEQAMFDYCQDDILEIYSIPDFLITYIDWDGLIKDMKQDYTLINIENTNFYYRQ